MYTSFMTLSLIIAFTGAYHPIFYRLLELGCLVYVFQSRKSDVGKYFLLLMTAFMSISVLYIFYHFDQAQLAFLNALYTLRLPVVLLATYVIFLSLETRSTVLKKALLIWFLFYLIVLIDLTLFIILGIDPMFSYGGGTIRVHGFVDPNSYAVFIWLTIIIARFFFFDIQRKKILNMKTLSWFLVAVLVFIFTGSRGAILGALIALFAEKLPSALRKLSALKMSKNIVTGILLFLTFIIMQFILLLLSNMTIVEYWRFDDTTGGSHRLERWVNAYLFMLSENYNLWFGTPMSSKVIEETIGGWPHNTYVKLLLNHGLLYLIVYILLFVITAIKVYRSSLAFNLLIFIFVTAATNDFATSPLIGFYFGVILALHQYRRHHLTNTELAKF